MAITVPQPTAWAVAHGGCDVINGRPVDYRGPVLIYAGAVWSETAAADERVRAAVDRVAGKFVGWHAYELAQLAGHVIAVADIADSHICIGCCWPWGDTPDGHYVDHLLLEHVQPLEQPVPCAAGDGRLWTPDPDVVDAVTAALGAAA